VLLVQGRGELAVMTAVIAVLLYKCAMGPGTECCVVSSRNRGNGDYACR